MRVDTNPHIKAVQSNSVGRKGSKDLASKSETFSTVCNFTKAPRQTTIT